MHHASTFPSLLQSNLDVSALTSDAIHALISTWFAAFESAIVSQDVERILALFAERCFWRDMLSLTWDFRTFHDAAQIREFLSACLHLADLNCLRLREETISLQQPFPDAVWIQTFFDFETKAGSGSGLVHLVPTPEGSWKAHSV